MRSTPELRAALRYFRLSRKWSYETLAGDMAETLGDRAPSLGTIYNFLDGSVEPFETTAFVIDEYLTAKEVAA